MTCIVAITDGQRTVMGGDSAGSTPDNPELYNFTSSKLWSTGEYLIGISGSYRAGQLARWEMDWPEPPEPGADLDRFMVREVAKTLKQTLQAAGFVMPPEPTRVPQFAVALRGRLFTITGDYSAVSMETQWIAIGSGRHSAYGAFHALAGFDLPLDDKVRRALAAAQRLNSNVREPFHLLESVAFQDTDRARTN